MKLDFVNIKEEKLAALPGETMIKEAMDDTKVLTKPSLESYSSEALPATNGPDDNMKGSPLMYRSLLLNASHWKRKVSRSSSGHSS